MASELALFTGEKTVTAKWPILGDAERLALDQVITNGKVSVLKKEGIISEFEDAFSGKLEIKHALSFSSGTASIHAACFACGVGPGWEVLTPAYTWISGITAILHGNGTPVFCDVAKGSFHIDPEEILRKATPRTKAVIVCHTWGLPAPMDEIMEAARTKGLKVIEDTSHSHGGKYKGRFLGTIGDIGCFSLQGSKAAEGAVVFPGYETNWYQAPILQDMDLFRQLWSYPNGTRYRPLKAGALPNTDSIVARTIVLPSWGQRVPMLAD